MHKPFIHDYFFCNSWWMAEKILESMQNNVITYCVYDDMYTNLSSKTTSSSSPGGRLIGPGELGGTGLDAELVDGDNVSSEMAAGAGG